MSPIKKLGGATPSEKILQDLCERSFLSLWSYPRLFRDQGKTTSQSDGKELCDLVVIFGNDVLLFSDKSCTFTDSGKLEVDWKRWHKRAIKKSIDQLFGAERWIRQFPDRLFLDSACTIPIPISLPNTDRLRFHRIAVALGAGDRCREHLGGSGSLMLAIPPDASSNEELPPFTIKGTPSLDKIVHVFDDVTLRLVLRELDTASDFIGYLRAKEKLISSGGLNFSAGEEELLAFYLSTADAEGDPMFPEPLPGRPFGITEGLWNELNDSEAYTLRRRLNSISYAWDGILENFNALILSEEMNEYGTNKGVSGHEVRVRPLASTSRAVRRTLVMSLYDFLDKVSRVRPKEIHSRVQLFPQVTKTAYLFIVHPSEGFPDEPTYREERRGRLIVHALLTLKRNPGIEDVVGISIGPREDKWGASEDIFHATRQQLTENDPNLLEQVEAEWATSRIEYSGPLPLEAQKTYSSMVSRTMGPNEKCPCGSGRKFIKCHGAK